MPIDLLGDAPSDLYITGELSARKTHPADFLREKQAIQELAARMVNAPEAVLPRFVDLAMQMTGGVSAGLSLFEPNPDPGVFRWRYLRGRLAPFEDATTPRNFSPCGITLDRNGPVLSLHPERFYNWIADANIVVPEVLLVPLFLGGGNEPMGTLWIVSDVEGHFNSEHARVASELAAFVGIAIKMLRGEQRLQSALEEQEMLAREMGHRVKNLLAVAEGMVRLTAKTTATKEELADMLTGRFHALAAAQGLIRRSFSSDGTPPKEANLIELLRTVVKPHERVNASGRDLFSIEGPALACGEHALNGIALVFQELATNAVKYGALSVDGGHIDIRWLNDDTTVKFIWLERAGPKIERSPTTAGFGSKLLRDTVERQFRGSLQHTWGADGLMVQMDIPVERLKY
ncbi:MAG: HWE histidine kinase domain-containing protein [Steroidobacteraceae bacterium]